MRSFFAVLLLAVPFASACGSDVGPTEPPAGHAEQSVKVCPYAVPYCPSDCKLVGACPQQCACNNGQSTLCGTQHCGSGQYCCNSTTAGYECLPIGYMCPL